VPLLEDGLRQAGTLNLQAHHPLRLAWLGETLVLAGQLERAAELAAQARALAEEQGERGSLAYVSRLAGEIAVRREPPDLAAAAAAYRDALGPATELGMRPLAARCRMGLATVPRGTGGRADARAERDAAIEGLRGLGMSHWLGRVEALRGS
jgi:predicted ATPase